MTTAATIHNYLQSPFLVCVDGDNLREVAVIEYIWRCIQWIFIGDAAFEDCKAAKVAEVAFNHILSFEHLEEEGLQFLEALKSKVKRAGNEQGLIDKIVDLRIRYLSTLPDLCSPREALVVNALKHMGHNKEITQVFHEALHLLIDLHKRLRRDIKTPIPLWFHATKSHSLPLILDGKKLEQRKAMFGFGVYVSSADETTPYGPYTFCLDAEAVETFPGYYYPAVFLSRALWVRVTSDVPINAKTVCWIAYQRGEEDALQDIREKHPWVRFVPRDVVDKVRNAFYKTMSRTLPSHWRWHENRSEPDKMPSYLKTA